jgi:hypothetical protein
MTPNHKEGVTIAKKSQDEHVDESKYIPTCEAYDMYSISQALNELFKAINGADGYWELLHARRMCELVLADEIKNLNQSIEQIRKVFPELEIPDYDGPVEVPYLAINTN